MAVIKMFIIPLCECVCCPSPCLPVGPCVWLASVVTCVRAGQLASLSSDSGVSKWLSVDRLTAAGQPVVVSWLDRASLICSHCRWRLSWQSADAVWHSFLQSIYICICMLQGIWPKLRNWPRSIVVFFQPETDSSQLWHFGRYNDCCAYNFTWASNSNVHCTFAMTFCQWPLVKFCFMYILFSNYCMYI